jgi:predicted kinase
VNVYITESADSELRRIVPLYLVNRAFIRGKVESFRLDDPLISPEAKEAAACRAQRFFRLARGYVLREKLPKTLFITCGPTGSGKTFLARELAFQLGLEHVSSDTVRKGLAGVAPTERGAAIYSHAWNQATYQRLFELCQSSLVSGISVIVDATFRSRTDRARFIHLAFAEGATPVLLALSCPAGLVRQRLEQREISGDSVSDGTWQIYQQQIATFEQPLPDEALLVSLDTGRTLVELSEQVLGALGLLP